MRKNHALTVAYQYLKRGCPIPVDVQGALIRSGISPAGLETAFARDADFSRPTIWGRHSDIDSPSSYLEEVQEVQALDTFRDFMF